MKYVICDNCGSEIAIGTEVYKPSGIAGIFCSATCYGEAMGEVIMLTTDEAENCYKEIIEK